MKTKIIDKKTNIEFLKSLNFNTNLILKSITKIDNNTVEILTVDLIDRPIIQRIYKELNFNIKG